jgi:hypothetical protein
MRPSAYPFLYPPTRVQEVARLAGGRWTSPGDLCAMLIQGINGTK